MWFLNAAVSRKLLIRLVDVLKPGGRLVVVGIPEFDRWSMNVELTRRKEISLQFIRRQVDCVETALEMMENGKIRYRQYGNTQVPVRQNKRGI